MIFCKGEKIYCENCKDHILTFACDIVWGMQFQEAHMLPEGQSPKFGERMDCKKCKTPYWRQFQAQAQRELDGKTYS